MIIIGLIAITAFGFLLVQLITPYLSQKEKIGNGFLIGIGIYTYLLFLFNLIGLKLTWFNVHLVLVAIVTVLGLFFYLKGTPRSTLKNFQKPKFSKTELFLISIISIIIFGSFISNIYWPIKDWDSLVLYDFRAKLLAETGSINGALKYMSPDSFIGYPLLTSLAHTYFYLWNVPNPLILYSLFFLSFLIICYTRFSKLITERMALIFTLLLAISPHLYDHAKMAYTNLPYTVYLVLGALYIYFWIRTEKNGFLILAAIMTGLSTWTRTTEPFWLGNIAIIGLYLFFFTVQNVIKFRIDPSQQKGVTLSNFIINLKSHSIKRISILCFIASLYIAIFYAFQLPWRIFIASQNYLISSNPVSYAVTAIQATQHINSNTLIQLTDYLFRFTILPAWPLFLTFILGFIYQIVSRKEIWFSLLVLVYFMILLIGAYIFASNYVGWQEIHGSLERMSMFFSPLLICLCVTLFANKELKNK